MSGRAYLTGPPVWCRIDLRTVVAEPYTGPIPINVWICAPLSRLVDRDDVAA